MTAGVQAPSADAHAAAAFAAPRVLRGVLRAVGDRSRRRTHAASGRAVHLEAIVDAFFSGYSAALGADDDGAIGASVTDIPPALRGFAYEGAGMALALVDWLLPAHPARLRRFLDGTACPHVYMAHVGAGWAAARLRRPPMAARRGLNPVIDWLAVDGYGFHQGYFHTQRVVRRAVPPRTTCAYTGRAFDQGVGRSLWFVDGADVDRIAATIRVFDSTRHADLWSGVGLASAYAGGVSTVDLLALTVMAGEHARHLAQGAAFAAEARSRAGNPAAHTEEACAIFAGRSADEASAVVRRCRVGLMETTELPAYELWRRRVADALVWSE